MPWWRRFTESWFPMVTPFTTDGRIDTAAVDRIVDHLMRAGIRDLLLLGTTGEPAPISARQPLHFLEAAMKRLGGRARVSVGLANNSFAETVAAAYTAMGSANTKTSRG